MAIAALVLGIVGCCLFMPLASIPAIILGAIALKKAKAEPERYGGHGMAMTGLVLGIVGLIVGIIAFIVMFSWFLPLVEFCEENPDDARCEGIAESEATSAHGLLARALLMVPVGRRGSRTRSAGGRDADRRRVGSAVAHRARVGATSGLGSPGRGLARHA